MIPHTRLATRLSGSARETETRIRNIFQGQRRRPPALLMVTVVLSILLCGSLISCQPGQNSQPPPQPPTDQALMSLLSSQVTDSQTGLPADSDLLLSYTAGSLTLGVARYGGGVHPAGFANLILWVTDSAGGPTGEPVILSGDDGRMMAWTEGERLYLLCTNTWTGQGWESATAVGWFIFDRTGLRQLTDPPMSAFTGAVVTRGLDTGLLNAALLNIDHTFWADHKAVPVNRGLQLFRRNPLWADRYPRTGGEPQWVWENYFPFFGSREDDTAPAGCRVTVDSLTHSDADPLPRELAEMLEGLTADDFPTRLSPLRPDQGGQDVLHLLAEDAASGAALYGVADRRHPPPR